MRCRLTKLAQAATLGFALAFTLSCSDDGDSGGGSACLESPSSFVDKGNDIAKYKTIKIGDQVWMAENLNYYVSGSLCNGECFKTYVGSVSSNESVAVSNAEVQANCDKYGRLYNWPTAMALPDSCTPQSCASQISEKHRGICPSGWHIPSDEEWDALPQYVDPTCRYITVTSFRTITYLDCKDAGTKLKATGGWNDRNDGSSGNGTDEYGFSALPGSFGYNPTNVSLSYGMYHYFILAGDKGYWWSSSNNNSLREFGLEDGNSRIRSVGDIAFGDKYYLLSVRCIQD